MEAIVMLSKEVKVDPELTSGVLCIFYQEESESGNDSIAGKALVGIKKVVRYFFPDFDLDLLDMLIPMMSEFKISNLT